MLKKVLPAALAALLLSAGAAFAEPPLAVTEANVSGVDDYRPVPLTDTDMVSLTGKGACTGTVEAIGVLKVVAGLVSLSHPMVILGQMTIGLAPSVCAL